MTVLFDPCRGWPCLRDKPGLVRLVVFACLCLAGLLGSEAYAQSDPWSVDVAVADRSVEEQQAAYAVALRRVLLDNSGDKTLLNRDEVRDGLREAESYVESFRYRTPEPGTRISRDAPLTDTVRRTGEATQLMRVTFDRTRVRELIDQGVENSAVSDDSAVAESPFASVESALLWMLIEDEEREIRISDEAAGKVRERLRELAGAGGISLGFPVGDDEDRETLDIEALRDFDIEALRAASARYTDGPVLVARLMRDGPRGWLGEWLRFAGEVEERTTFETERLDPGLQAGIDWLSPAAGSGADEYRYGGLNGSDTELLIAVSALDGTAAYAEVMRFFEAIPSVSTVYPKEIIDDTVIFSVYPRSALPVIDQQVAASDRLRLTAPLLEPAPTRFGSAPRLDGPAPGRTLERRKTSDLAHGVELDLEYLR